MNEEDKFRELLDEELKNNFTLISSSSTYISKKNKYYKDLIIKIKIKEYPDIEIIVINSATQKELLHVPFNLFIDDDIKEIKDLPIENDISNLTECRFIRCYIDQILEAYKKTYSWLYEISKGKKYIDKGKFEALLCAKLKNKYDQKLPNMFISKFEPHISIRISYKSTNTPEETVYPDVTISDNEASKEIYTFRADNPISTVKQFWHNLNKINITKEQSSEVEWLIETIIRAYLITLTDTKR